MKQLEQLWPAPLLLASALNPLAYSWRQTGSKALQQVAGTPRSWLLTGALAMKNPKLVDQSDEAERFSSLEMSEFGLISERTVWA